jgi:FeS assembly SUF system protein
MRLFRRKNNDDERANEPRPVRPTPIPPPRPYQPAAEAQSPDVAAAVPVPDAAAANPDAAAAAAAAPIPTGSIADMLRVPSHARDSDDMPPLHRAIVDVLRSIYDPEIPVNIYDIGLIYDIDIKDEGDVDIRMTLTSPMCPVAETLPPEVEAKVSVVDGVRNVHIDLVWEPTWTPAMMSDDARLLLNMM